MVSTQPTFRVQSQIRENATRLQDALVDLIGWEAGIKKKDKQIRRSGRTGVETERGPSSSAPVPSVRRNGTKAIDKPSDLSQGDIETVETLKTSASHTHDRGYTKWENFDVEAALHAASSSDDERTEKDEEQYARDQAQTERQRHQQLLTPATIVGTIPKPTSRQRVPAAIGSESAETIEAREREKGNALFQNGDFQAAIKAYTKCLLINNRSLSAFSNRAMAHIKLKEHTKAEADCTLALELDENHVNTLLRHATARNALGKYRAALVDLLVAGGKGDNHEAVKAATQTRAMIRSAVLRCPKVRVAVKLAQLPSAVPLDMDKDKERLADAVSSKYVSSVPILTADDETATTATINDNGGNHQCVSHEMTSNGVHENILEERRVQKQLEIEGVKQQSHSDEVCVPLNSSGFHSTKATTPADIAVNKTSSNLLSQRQPPIPRTSYEMERSWRNMKAKSNQERLAWLKRFKQSTWSNVFNISTDGEFLGNVLQCIHGSDSERLCKSALCGLSQAKGMKLVALTLPNEARILLSELLFKRVAKNGMVSSEEITSICDVFQLSSPYGGDR